MVAKLSIRKGESPIFNLGYKNPLWFKTRAGGFSNAYYCKQQFANSFRGAGDKNVVMVAVGVNNGTTGEAGRKSTIEASLAIRRILGLMYKEMGLRNKPQVSVYENVTSPIFIRLPKALVTPTPMLDGTLSFLRLAASYGKKFDFESIKSFVKDASDKEVRRLAGVDTAASYRNQWITKYSHMGVSHYDGIQLAQAEANGNLSLYMSRKFPKVSNSGVVSYVKQNG